RAYALLFSRGKIPLPPLHAFFEVTYRCNLRCRFCQFLGILENKSPATLREAECTLSEIRAIIDQVPSHTLITLSGGEPLLRHDFCEIAEYACRRHKVHVITNGTLMNETIARRLMGLRMKNPFGDGLLWVSFSLVGHRKTHDCLTGVPGSFDMTVAGIRRLLKVRKSRYPCVNVQTVINRTNTTSLRHIIEVAKDLGVGICNLMVENSGNHFDRESVCEPSDVTSTPSIPRIHESILNENLKVADTRARELGVRIRYPMGGRKHLEDYYSGRQKVSDFLCYAPWTTMMICADGEVRSCFGHSFGSLKTQSLRQVWWGNKMQVFRSGLLRAGTFPGCIGCCMLQPKGKDSIR
ncbi:MAG: hypothetical protein DRH24_19280, partial [Deltaproteobacteria bacterium]